jgi:hypothetical protein
MEQNVLEDFFSWLSDPVRDFKKLTILSTQMPEVVSCFLI